MKFICLGAVLTVFVSCKQIIPDNSSSKSESTSADKSGMYSESDLSEKYNKDFRTRFFSDQLTKEKLNDLIREYDAGYDKLPPDVQLLTIHMSNMQPFRGIVWRLVPLFTSTTLTHAVALGVVRGMASNIERYLPTKQWDIGSKYISEPADADKPTSVADEATRQDIHTWNAQFKQPAEVVAYIKSAVIPAFEKNARRLEALYQTTQRKPILWDNKVFYGAGTFDDGLKRFQLVGPAEIALELMGTYKALHDFNLYVSYRKPDLVRIVEGVGRAIGVGAVISDGVLISPKREIVTVLNRGDFKDTNFILDPSSGAATMQAAWDNLRKSVRWAGLAKQSLDKNDAGANTQYMMVSPTRANMYQNITTPTLRNVEAIVYGNGGSYDKEGSFPSTIKSALTGETEHIDIKLFYQSPPKDLKWFLPTAFQMDNATKQTASGTQYKNYLYGRATEWQYYRFSPYLKGANDAKSLQKTSRILSQSWGGWFVNTPLTILAM